MAIIVPNEGELELLEKMIKDALSTDEDYNLKLFANNYTPVSTSTSTDFDEPVFTDYVTKTLTRANFGSAVTLANGDAYIEYDTEQVWTVGAVGDIIYGYFVEGTTSGKVLWAERLDASATVVSGDEIKITPSFTLQSKRT